MPPVISNIVLTATESTIVATWTTDISADSNLTVTGGSFPSGKNAIDNGVAANSTSHQCVVTGLDNSTVFSCVVTSGATSSSPQNKTTLAAPDRTAITSVEFGTPTATSNDGDIPYNFTSNDNVTYMVRDDAKTPPGGAGSNQQLDQITNETTLAISQVNGLSAYGTYSTTNGTDGPGGIALSNKGNGLFGMAGSLFMFTGRHEINGSTRRQFYGNVIRSDDKGATWSNFNNPTTFNANGIPAFPNSGNNSVAPFFFGNNSNWGWVTPVRYAADDGTLGYNTAGNQIDGGNAYCYFTIIEQNNDSADYIMLGRIPRIQLFALNYSAAEFWIGPTSPTPADFVNDTNWQTSASGLTRIYSNVGKVGWQDICYVPAINRYVLFSGYRPVVASTSNTVWLVMEGPTPAGPWTQVGSLTNNPSGYYGHTVLHRTAFSNVQTQAIPLRAIYSGDFNNQPTYYHPTYSTLKVYTGGFTPGVYVQGKGSTSAQSGTTATLAYTSNVTSGNLLCVAWRYNGSGAARLNSVTSTQTTGNWTIVYDQSDGGGTPIQGGWAYALATSTGANTVSMNFGTSVVGVYMAMVEHSGPVAFRSASSVAVTNETALTSNAATAAAGDLAIGFTTMGAAVTNTLTAGATGDYTLRVTGLNGSTQFVGIESNLATQGGSTTASFNSSEHSSSIKATVGVGIFTSLFSITGSAGVAGATVSWSGASSGSVTADGSGNYNTGNLIPGSYTITPSKTGYSFSPSNSSQTITNANITGVNFTATQIVVATPTFSPVAGSYGPSQSITVNDTDSGLGGFAMYYTTDGSTPTTSSTLYTGSVTVSSSLTLKVLATATGYANSTVGSAAYTVNGAVATPTFSPVAGTYSATQSVTISTATAGASIFYTTDGSTPTSGSTPYTVPVSVSLSQTLKAIATKTNFSNSAVGTATYVVGSVYSVPDSRVHPNSSRVVQATITYDVQTSSNPSIPPTDSRASVPVDDRATSYVPENSRSNQ